MYGNPALFEERGVTPPTLDNQWTWDQCVQASKELTFTRADGTEVYGFSASTAPNQVVYLPIFYMDGGRVHSPDARVFSQNSPDTLFQIGLLNYHNSY